MIDRSDGASRIRFGPDGRFVLRAPLGTRGAGGVFLAEDVEANVQRAIKLLDLGAVPPEAAERFRAEARVLSTLRHPNVVRAWTQGQDYGFCWYVMDYLPGGSLADHLRVKGPAPAEHALALVFQVLMGLGAIHGAGLVHRDTKLTNVLIDERGNPRVSDFGIAHHPKGTVGFETIPGQTLGTPGYGAPEQWAHAGTVGAAADVFATGVLLYRLLTRKHPESLHLAHLRPKLLEVVPEPCREVLLTSTRMDPNDRYASAEDMARAVVRARDLHLGRSDEPRWMCRFRTPEEEWGSDTATLRGWLEAR